MGYLPSGLPSARYTGAVWSLTSGARREYRYDNLNRLSGLIASRPRSAGRQLTGSVMELHPIVVHGQNQVGDMLGGEGVAEDLLGHVPTGRGSVPRA